MQTLTLSIKGMTCGHCVARVRAALEAIPGAAVRHVRVGSAQIALGGATDPTRIVEAVQEAGYEAAVTSTNEIAKTANAGCACCAPAPAALTGAERTSRQ